MRFFFYYDISSPICKSVPQVRECDVINEMILNFSWKLIVENDVGDRTKWIRYSLDELCFLEAAVKTNLLPFSYESGPVWVNFETKPFRDPDKWRVLDSKGMILNFIQF